MAVIRTLLLLCILGIAAHSAWAATAQSWVNIKDPTFGATGNGSTDDTAAIQAAIDYAYANSITAIYCPSGSYKTSNTVWLDPSNNMRATTWTGTGYFSSGTFTISTTTTGTFGGVGSQILAASGGSPWLLGGSAGPTYTISGTGPYTVNNSFTLGSSGSPVSLIATTPSSPTNSAFSLTFFGDPAAGGNYQACQIRPTFSNAPAFLAGSGQGMRVSDIAVISPASGTGANYRGNLSSPGVGIGLTGGSAGSSINLVENTYVAGFYSLYETDANGACCLNDSNTFRKITGYNGYYGVNIEGTQSDINDVVEPRLAVTLAIYSPVGRAVNVYGGNLSAYSGKNSSFAISSVSSFSKTSDGSGYDYTFTAVIASPDSYIPNVYNSFEIITPHFGIVPMTMTSWNAGTDTATFKLLPNWVFSNFDTSDLTSANAIQTDIAAATTVYASERVTVAYGTGTVLDGVHIENPVACQTFLVVSTGGNGQNSVEARSPFFNSDPSAPSGVPAQLCQASFPFINDYMQSVPIQLRGGEYDISSAGYYLNVDFSQTTGTINGENLQNFYPQFRSWQTGGYAYSPGSTEGQMSTQQTGFGRWDSDIFLPTNAGYHNGFLQATVGFLSSSFCGYYPCQELTPNLPPSYYSEVSGSLGALGSYPPISCQTEYKSIEWNSGTLTYPGLRSASCPGFSYGQSLTTALVGETLTWSYQGQSDALYLDAKTMSWMFPGLGISLGSPGAGTYVVTGVYPAIGSSAAYVTVLRTDSGGFLAGTSGTSYSCASSCSIGQAAYSWTAYP